MSLLLLFQFAPPVIPAPPAATYPSVHRDIRGGPYSTQADELWAQNKHGKR